MRKVTLTLLVFLGGISIASAQSGATTPTSTSEKKVVESNKQVVIKKDLQPVKIKSAKLHKLERMPKKQEAAIEEKKTNQK